MENDLFIILPDNFFTIFTSTNKKLYVDGLFFIFDYFHDNKIYSEIKTELIKLLTVKFSKEDALKIISKLKECGWIYEEYNSSKLNFTYYALQVIETLNNLKRKHNFFCSGFLFSIYSMLKNFDSELLFEIITQIVYYLEIFFSHLNILYSNIKLYIDSLLFNNDIKNIVKNLLIDYQENIINKYQLLKTSDNLSRYRPYIISKLNEISLNNEYLSKQINDIIISLYDLDNIIEEIDRQNHLYIKRAINKIFILIRRNDTLEKIKIVIDYIVKNKNQQLTNKIFNINKISFLTKKSLYTKPKKEIKTKQIIKVTKSLDQNLKQQYIKKIFTKSRFSKQNIIEYIKEVLKDNTSILASELLLNHNEDYLRIIYIYMYAKNNYYKIELLKKQAQINGIVFNDFLIKRVDM